MGLSLSYDIIKAHGGEIKVETKEGEGSEFIIQLPVYDSPLGDWGLTDSLQQNQQDKEQDWD